MPSASPPSLRQPCTCTRIFIRQFQRIRACSALTLRYSTSTPGKNPCTAGSSEPHGRVRRALQEVEVLTRKRPARQAVCHAVCSTNSLVTQSVVLSIAQTETHPMKQSLSRQWKPFITNKVHLQH